MYTISRNSTTCLDREVTTMKTADKKAKPNCPECGENDSVWKESAGLYFCEDCQKEFRDGTGGRGDKSAKTKRK